GCRPRLQVLEDRTLPATVFWTNPAGGDWSAASNWSTGILPGPSDDVVIGSPISGATITHSTGSDAIRSLHIHDNAFRLSGGSLSLAAASDTDSDFNLTSNTLSGGTLSLNGNFVTSGNTTWGEGTVQGAGQWVNAGTLAITP